MTQTNEVVARETSAGWPEVNALAFIDLVDEPVMLQSRVERIEGTAITLAAPVGAYGIPVLPSPGETVVVAWNTDGSRIQLVCTPARMYAVDDQHVEVGLTFVDLDERTANQVRKHVFAQQVRDRAMGLL